MSRQGYAVITILKCSFCSTGKLVSEEIQNGPPRRDAGTIPLVLYICSGHDDQDLFSVWKDEESERPSITAAISVGDALPIWHSWRRGKGLVCCLQYFCPPEEFVLKQLILHQRRIFSQEVSGGRNYPQPDNIACLSSHIPSVYIPVLYYPFFFFFFLLSGLAGNYSEWLYDDDIRPPISCSRATCCLLIRTEREESWTLIPLFYNEYTILKLQCQPAIFLETYINITETALA